MEQIVQELAEAQKRTEERLARLEQVVQELAEAQKRTEGGLQILRGRFEGLRLEEYCRHRPFFFSRVVRRPAVLSPNEVSNMLEDAIDAGTLTEDEAYFLGQADLFVRGYHRRDNTPLYLAVEVSVRVDTEDVGRAVLRRNLLTKAGYTALPVVVGESVHELAEKVGQGEGVQFIVVKRE